MEWRIRTSLVMTLSELGQALSSSFRWPGIYCCHHPRDMLQSMSMSAIGKKFKKSHYFLASHLAVSHNVLHSGRSGNVQLTFMPFLYPLAQVGFLLTLVTHFLDLNSAFTSHFPLSPLPSSSPFLQLLFLPQLPCRHRLDRRSDSSVVFWLLFSIALSIISTQQCSLSWLLDLTLLTFVPKGILLGCLIKCQFSSEPCPRLLAIFLILYILPGPSSKLTTKISASVSSPISLPNSCITSPR